MFGILSHKKRIEVKSVFLGSRWGTVNIKEELEAQKKHTLQQVYDWGNEPCYEHQLEHRKDCPDCWAELQKGAQK